MPRTLQTVDEFQGYLKRAMSRALHHGHNVPAVVLLLAGAVLWKKEGSVEARTHGSQTANCLWVRINGRRYAFSYVHDKNNNGWIEIRRDSLRGNVIRKFDNSSDPVGVLGFFNSL